MIRQQQFPSMQLKLCQATLSCNEKLSYDFIPEKEIAANSLRKRFFEHSEYNRVALDDCFYSYHRLTLRKTFIKVNLRNKKWKLRYILKC